MERFTEGELTLQVSEEQGDLVVLWLGRSTARHPGAFILPILNSAMERAQREKRRFVLDFRQLEYLNSSTIAPVIRVLEHAKRGDAQLTVRYNAKVRWQSLAFSTLYMFGTPDGRVAIVAQ